MSREDLTDPEYRIERIADALERIATALEPKPGEHINHDQSERLIAAQERNADIQERQLAIEEHRLGLNDQKEATHGQNPEQRES